MVFLFFYGHKKIFFKEGGVEMIDKNDKFANILNKLNIIFIVIALIGGTFMYIDFLCFHNFCKITMVTGLGFLFLVMGISLYMYYLYLLLRWIKRKLNCNLSEYLEIVYIEIEGNGAFEKYYPVLENLFGKEMVSKYSFPEDSFSVGEKVEILWNTEKTEYIFTKFNYLGQFISLILASLLMSWFVFLFFINQHTFLFELFLIVLTLIIFLCDTIQTIIEDKNK